MFNQEIKEENSEASEETEDCFVVEAILGFRFYDGLKFYVKWDKYPYSCSTFEPLDHLRDNIIFRNYLESLEKTLQRDIDIHNETMKWNLKKQIISALVIPKDIILKDMIGYNKYDFKAFQVVYHLIKPNEEFNKQYDILFIQHFIIQVLKKQKDDLNELLLMIQEQENRTVMIENEVDFTVPIRFKYITENLNSDEVESEMKTSLISRLNSSHYSFEPPLTQVDLCVFKTNLKGWGLKTLTKITKGHVITECVGKVLTLNEANRCSDKSYFYPAEMNFSGKRYIIDALEEGNLARFVNHSIFSNAQIYSPLNNGEMALDKLLLYATDDIEAGKEITISYNNLFDH